MSLDNAQVNTLNLLDAQLDDLKDLPEWKTFPAGVYLCKPDVKIEQKDKEGTVITVTATLLENGIIEIGSDVTEDSKPVVGSQTSVRYNWDNEFGQGALKNLLKPVAAAFGGKVTKVTDLLEAIKTSDSLKFVMGVREGKAKDGKPAASFQQFTDLIVS